MRKNGKIWLARAHAALSFEACLDRTYPGKARNGMEEKRGKKSFGNREKRRVSSFERRFRSVRAVFRTAGVFSFEEQFAERSANKAHVSRFTK